MKFIKRMKFINKIENLKKNSLSSKKIFLRKIFTKVMKLSLFMNKLKKYEKNICN